MPYREKCVADQCRPHDPLPEQHLRRGRALTRAQKATNRRIARRRVRIEHVNSSVKRCRIVHDTSRLRKAGVRDLVMEICCALHNFRVRLIPWQPMV